MSLTAKERKIKKVWVDALRNGGYKQAEGCLYDPDTKGFCCLGVLEHKLLKGSVEDEWDEGNCEAGEVVPPASMPSPTFYETFGLQWVAQRETRLAEMNDQDQMDFSQIADFIEDNWK